MVVLVTCKNEEDPIKMKALVCLHVHTSIFQTLKAAYSAAGSGISPKFELIQALMVVLVTCKNEKDPIKNEGTRVLTTFLPL